MTGHAGGAAALLLLASFACGPDRPPPSPPVVRGPDGREYYRLDRGAYNAYYGPDGRLQRVDYDQDGDGRPDHIAHHDGARTPHLIEVDEDRDGHVDRWETYDAGGVLRKVGTSRRGAGPDLWTVPGPGGAPARREYDDDGDGRAERAETLEQGAIVAVELDLDRDGRPDRWQSWRSGRLVSEDVDGDGDGRADLRIRRGSNGEVEGLERLPR